MGMAKARILVVDDDPDLVESYRALLEAAGYQVAAALSGAVALELARADRPDVVLTDISMPHMDGFELIQKLRHELGPAAPKVVVCSAFEITEHECIARGAELFLEKPTSGGALIASVEALRRGARPDAATVGSERSKAEHERTRALRGSERRLRELDRAALARTTEPWLDWLRRFFDCDSGGVFLLEGGAVVPLVVVGAHMAERPEPGLLHATLAAGVETGTSLVVADMTAHPAFREALGPRPDIAFFAGVPLVTSDGVRVGALCIADSQPSRFDADSLMLMEYLGRRGVAGLLESARNPTALAPPVAPLLRRPAFEMVLGTELRMARRRDDAVEIALASLTPSATPEAFAQRVWNVAARARLAIGAMGAGRVGIFARGPSETARRHIALGLEAARAGGMLEAAGWRRWCRRQPCRGAPWSRSPRAPSRRPRGRPQERSCSGSSCARNRRGPRERPGWADRWLRSPAVTNGAAVW